MENKSKIIIIISIFFLVGLFFGCVIGFGLGVKTTISNLVDVAQNFIDIDEKALKDALFLYKNNINRCIP